MLKRPKRDESEEDILRMQQEFFAEKAKNPKMQAAAKIVKVEKASKKSLFAQNRQRQRIEPPPHSAKPNQETTPTATTTSYILGEIHEKIVGDSSSQHLKTIPNLVLGEVVEYSYSAPKEVIDSSAMETDPLPFPKIPKQTTPPLNTSSYVPGGKSIFAMSLQKEKVKEEVNKVSEEERRQRQEVSEVMDCDSSAAADGHQHLSMLYGQSSAIVEDEKTASEVHQANVSLLSGMSEADILAERQKLLSSIDPSLIALLAKKRKEKAKVESLEGKKEETAATAAAAAHPSMMITDELLATLPNNNPAFDILQMSESENWIHFDVVEKDKLQWMHDISQQEQAEKLKPGEKFEARFDWKGVLLPYTTSVEETTTASSTSTSSSCSSTAAIKDERELYLHGSEPHRPGYTLQELFRLARSNVVQQRVSAFGAIAGILNIYNQGFYDKVLELPITKIFFLIRFGLDDNTLAMLEVVSKALALLCYNETDETLLDFNYDNPNCYWQPILNVTTQSDKDDADDPTSIENLQRQMKQLQMSSNFNRRATTTTTTTIRANVDETEDESKTSMSDFQLAETDLIECLLRTNIQQRILFILNTVRPDNSTVLSCLKILIRLARSSKDVAVQIAKNDALIDCIFENFLPGLEHIDTMQRTAPMYNYPQYLCLKFFRVLISQDLGIAVRFLKLKIVDKLQNYLFSSDDLRGKLIKVQIESLRVLRCLLLLRIDNFLYRRFLPAFRFMLEWHFNHNIYDLGSSHLIRQHAAALLSAISSFNAGCGNTLEMSATLGEILHNCCCNWFHHANRNGIKEFSQSTLLSCSLHAITCYIHHCGMTTVNSDAMRFKNFIEKYLRNFIDSEVFVEFINSLNGSSSILLRDSPDRRNIHAPLPNCGSIIMHRYGPQLIVSQTYMVHLLNSIWRLLELIEKTEEQLCFIKKSTLLDVIIQPRIVEPLVEYLRGIATKMNLYAATNYFAKSEIQLIYRLLCFEGISTYFTNSELIQIAYNFLCSLSATHITEIEHILERYIFNRKYLEGVDVESLNKWRTTCLELVYPHCIVLNPNEITLSIPHSQMPVLPRDWPYFQLKIILQNYIDNVQQKPASLFSEREVLLMTFTFVSQLEKCNPNLEIVTPTERLMYFMIAFMGPDSEFLDAAAMRPLLEEQMRNFYAQCVEYTFQFDASYEGKCKFENLYALFVDHFQAASYGDELFSSLVMIPLAQKYDNKWRRRLWSDYASALRFLHCEENWLIGGFKAYIEPPEEDKSLIRAYDMALRTNLLRTNSLPYRIAKYHVEKFKEIMKM